MFQTRRLYKPSRFSLLQRCYSTTDYSKESTFAMIKPDGITHLGPIFGIVHREGFKVKDLKMSKFSKPIAKKLYDDIIDKDFYPSFSDYITSGPVVGMRLTRLDAVNHWRQVMGPTDPKVAKQESPNSIRAQYGKSMKENIVHGAKDQDQVVAACNLFFSSKSLLTRDLITYPNVVLTLTPSFLEEGRLETLFDHIKDSELELNTMRMYHSSELNKLCSKIGKDVSAQLFKEGATEGDVIVVELSHPEGYQALQEEMVRLETFTGVSSTHLDKGDSKVAEKLFL